MDHSLLGIRCPLLLQKSVFTDITLTTSKCHDPNHHQILLHHRVLLQSSLAWLTIALPLELRKSGFLGSPHHHKQAY